MQPQAALPLQAAHALHRGTCCPLPASHPCRRTGSSLPTSQVPRSTACGQCSARGIRSRHFHLNGRGATVLSGGRVRCCAELLPSLVHLLQGRCGRASLLVTTPSGNPYWSFRDNSKYQSVLPSLYTRECPCAAPPPLRASDCPQVSLQRNTRVMTERKHACGTLTGRLRWLRGILLPT